jgi:two-component system, NarL family, sensor kinase
VSHEGEIVGALEVVKDRGYPVTPTEQRLITDLAGSVGLLLGHQRLNASLAARAAELRSSRRRLVELGDAERRRLERDLHDGAQQQVVALKLKIALGQHIARKAGDEGAALRLGHLTEEVQETLEEIRRVARGIYPQLVESESVVTAIRTRALGCPVPVDVSAANVGAYPPDVQAAVYFAAVEAITNAVAYAGPGRIEVGITDTGDEIVVAVTDDGSGFDPGSTGEGVGLTNIRDRVEALGGKLMVRSALGAGTTIEARIPVERRDSRETDGAVMLSGFLDPAPHSIQGAGHEVRLG